MEGWFPSISYICFVFLKFQKIEEIFKNRVGIPSNFLSFAMEILIEKHLKETKVLCTSIQKS